MRKIEKILERKFNRKQVCHLYKAWIMNGCWEDWWVNFDRYLADFLILVAKNDNYDYRLRRELEADIVKICEEHDFDFFAQKWFYHSNWKMCVKIFKLLKWWAWVRRSLYLAISLFFILNRIWKNAYKK